MIVYNEGMINGKILFYDEAKGNGIIITTQKEKYSFYIGDWDDFETMPSVGIEVEFELKHDKPAGIVCKKQESDTEDELEEDALEKFMPHKTVANTQSPKEHKTHRYQNETLTEAEDELVALMNTSEESLHSLGEKINLTVNLSDTMHKYFQTIKQHIQKRQGYKKVDGRLNYVLAKRFIWTTFNNLIEIDPRIVTLRIKSISTDLKFMGTLHDDFNRKTRYPALAFEDIFLSYQTEYKQIKEVTLQIAEKLALLKAKEKAVDNARKKKQQEIEKTEDKEQLIVLTKELKSLNGTYVDVVHMIAQLQEEHTLNRKKLLEFENSYKDDFYKKFQAEASKYKKFLLDILDAQAYLLDMLLWREAKVSKAIRFYFKELPVDVELNTRGYLKYYLSTLDEEKCSESTKELYELYEHLLEVHKDYILVVCANAQEAMDYEQVLQPISKTLGVKAFIDEMSALKWAINHSVKYIVIEQYLQITNAKKFLDAYHNNIFSKPKIIVIGEDSNTQHSKQYDVTKALPQNSSPHSVASTLKKMITSSK